jgi:protein SCO1/2
MSGLGRHIVVGSLAATVVVLAALVFASTAWSSVTATDLQQATVLPPEGARVALESRWTDQDGRTVTLAEAMGGRPTLLIFADYTCQSLCGSVLSLVTGTLAKSGLDLREYRVLALGIDAKDGPAEAAAMRRRQVTDDAVAAVTTMLVADNDSIRAVAESVGYRFVYDAERDQFVHPAAVLVLAKDGRLTRVLAALDVGPDQIRSALIEAGQGDISSFRRAISVLCYGFDPSIGRYTGSVRRALITGGVFTILAFAGAIGWMSLRPSRPR